MFKELNSVLEYPITWNLKEPLLQLKIYMNLKDSLPTKNKFLWYHLSQKEVMEFANKSACLDGEGRNVMSIKYSQHFQDFHLQKACWLKLELYWKKKRTAFTIQWAVK